MKFCSKSLTKNGDWLNENISRETIWLAANHVAAVSLFWKFTNMAAMISCENALLTERCYWIKIISLKNCLSQNLLFFMIFCNRFLCFTKYTK